MCHTYIPILPPSKYPSSQKLRWSSSYHQLLLALQTRNIKETGDLDQTIRLSSKLFYTTYKTLKDCFCSQSQIPQLSKQTIVHQVLFLENFIKIKSVDCKVYNTDLPQHLF